MRVRPAYDWPPERARLRRRAIRLEWITLAAMATVVVAMFFAMGSSQAMRTAWIEDLLGFVPAIAFLVAARVERKPPNAAFPHGHYRAVSIAYLVGATAVLAVGLFLLFDNATTLLAAEHPTIGAMEVFGHDLWQGWVMIAALAYSAVPPVILGRLKEPVARDLHDKVLVADAAMQKADWSTALAAIAGILGVACGLWWADAAAALVIALDVTRDGARHVARATMDLADRSPTTVERDRPHPAIAAARQAALSVPWVADAEVELREEGHLITGTLYVVPRDGAPPLARLEELRRRIERAHWQLYEVVIAPVAEGGLEASHVPEPPARAATPAPGRASGG